MLTWFVLVVATSLLGPLPLQGDVSRSEGGIVRGPVDERRIALVFTGHEFAEGAPTILDALSRRKAHASFFLTGAFLRNPEFAPLIRRILADEHGLGPHSDAHLLYCPWTGPNKTLVTRDEFGLPRQSSSRGSSPGLMPAGVYRSRNVGRSRRPGCTMAQWRRRLELVEWKAANAAPCNAPWPLCVVLAPLFPEAYIGFAASRRPTRG